MNRYSNAPWRNWADSSSKLCMGLGTILFTLGLLYIVLRLEAEPFWVLVVLVVPIASWLLVRHLPVLLLAAFLFVGVLKPEAARGISLTDPTLLVAAGVAAAVGVELLLVFAGREPWRLRELFSGQVPALLTFGSFMLVIAISLSYTPDPQFGATKLVTLTTFDTLAFFAPLVLLRHSQDVRRFLAMDLILSFFLAARLMARLTSGPNPTGVDVTEIGPGMLVGVAVLILLYYPISTHRLYRILAIAGILSLTLAVAMSVSRSALFSLLLAAVISLIILPHPPAICSRRAMALGLAAILLLVPLMLHLLTMLPAAHDKFVQKQHEVIQLFGGEASGTAGQRVSFAESAISAFLAKPLLGWGVGGWSTLYHMSDERVLRHPHNFVLEVAAEEGIVGLLALAGFLLALWKALGKILKARRHLFAIPVLLLCVFSDAASGQVDDRILWLWCGVVLALARLDTVTSLSPLRKPRSGSLSYGSPVSR